MSNYKIKICNWMDADEFRTLLKVMDYSGREQGCSIFMPSPSKVRTLLSLGEEIDTIFEVLKKYNEEAYLKLIDFILRIKKETPVIVKLVSRARRTEYAICSKWRLAKILEPLRVQGEIKYSRELGCYTIKPYYLLEAVKELEENGLQISDETKIVKPMKRIKIELRTELRDYQKEALESWKNNLFRGVVSLPMGAGKTIVAIAAISMLRAPTLVVVYTKEQLQQWKDMLLKLTNLSEGQIGLFYGSFKRIAPITISTYQSAYRHLNILFDKFSILIVDEAHHLPADKFKTIAEIMAAPYRMGLSATPYRDDGKHTELFKLMGGLVYHLGQKELIERGYIAPFDIIPVRISLDKAAYKHYKELISKLSLYARGSSIDTLIKKAVEGDVRAKEALTIINEIRRLLVSNESKMEALKNIVEKEVSKGSKVIVFVPYVDLAEKIASTIGGVCLTGRTDEDIRRKALEKFRKGEQQILVTTTVGDEGLDIPDAEVGVMVSTHGSKRQIKQRLGRLLRPAPGKKARLYVLIAKKTMEEKQFSSKFSELY